MSLRSSSSSRERNKYGGICCELRTRPYSAISMSVARHRKTRFSFGSTSSYANRRPLCRGYYVSFLIWNFIIHQIFSLARDWSKRVTWANNWGISEDIPQFLKPMDNKHNSLNLAAKICSDICRGHYQFREANSFPRAKLRAKL